MKKYLFIVLFSLSVFSCGDDAIGEGVNPKLNISEYTFPKEGGSIEVYSQRGVKLMISIKDKDIIDSVYCFYNGGIRGYDCGWFVAAFPVGNYYYNLNIEVSANDTGEEREIPISIMSGDYGCSTKYVQEK